MLSGTTIDSPLGPTAGRLRSPLWAAGALLVLAGLAYANTIFHPFLYDDRLTVIRNPEIRSLSNLPEIVGFRDGGFVLRDRFTRAITHAFEFALVGTWAPLYHLDNILLHALVAFLVLTLVTRLTEDRRIGFWTAALWVVHPIQTEVVAQVAGRRELLMSAFALGFLLAMQRYLCCGGRWRVALAMLLLTLGVCSKEGAVMAAPIVILLDVYRARTDVGGGTLRELARTTISRALTSKWMYAIAAAGTILLLGSFLLWGEHAHGLGGSTSEYEDYGPPLGLLDRVELVGLALRMYVLPIGQSTDYNYDALGFLGGGAWSLPALVNLALLVSALSALVHGLVRRSWVGFGLAWFFVFYMPHMGIVSWHHIFAERFLYLSSIGLSLAVAASAPRLLRAWGPALRPATAGALLLALLTIATAARNSVYESGVKLWSAAVARYPDSARAHYSLASHYLRENRPVDAAEHYREALRVLPPFLDAKLGLAASLMATGGFAEAQSRLDEFLERMPHNARAIGLKGLAQYALEDRAAALATFERAVAVDPSIASNWDHLGRLHRELGNTDKAIEMYETAIARDASLVTSYVGLSEIYRDVLGDLARATRYERQARELLRFE